MTDKILFDITSVICVVCWILIIYYGTRIGKNIENLYELNGNLQEVFFINKIKEFYFYKKGGIQ